jgi:Tol biopolymer transport system component/C-terminal processing protease CtpA/Prc
VVGSLSRFGAVKDIVMKLWVGLWLIVAALHSVSAQETLTAVPPRPIVGMNTPALSPDGTTVCFSYQGDLWTVPAVGGVATRITIHPAHDAYPRWSPDGKMIAFASNRYASSGLNYDVFVMPASGGEPKRLTYHTNNDYPSDWSPDGKRILMQAIRGGDTWQAMELNVETLATRSVTDDRNLIRYPVYSPDGKTVAYNRSGRTGAWWRPAYHGSANMDIWLQPSSERKPVRFTDYGGTDLWPMFSGDGRSLYYVSDCLTHGVPNIVVAPLDTRKPAAVTRHKDGAVTWPNMARNGSAIVYVNSGDLYVLSLRDRSTKKLTVFASGDVKVNRKERLALTSGATELEVSPDGKHLGMVLRGDLWTVPADKGGDARRITDSPAHDHDFVWSPDSKQMAFISDRDGLFALYVVETASLQVRRLAQGSGDVSMPHWSPDGTRLAYLLSGPESGVYVVKADGQEAPRRLAASEGNNRFGVGINSHSWSPDGKWIAFSRRDARNGTDIWVVSVAGSEPVNVTAYPGSNEDPEWSSDGKYLAFLSSRDRVEGSDLYVLDLVRPNDQGAKEDAAASGGDVKIEFDAIEERARRLTTSGVSAFVLTPDGKTALGITSFGTGPDLFSVPLSGGPLQRVTSTGDISGSARFGTSADRFWCLVRGGSVRRYERAGPSWSASPVAFEARLELDRIAERSQVFAEFWRSIATGFYDAGMHGRDWNAIRRRYEPLLDGAATAEEFAFFVLSPMAGELNASHIEVSPNVSGAEPEVADLGLTFDETYAGPGLKVTGYVRNGPNGGKEPQIKPGEYVLAINGKDVVWSERLWPLLAGTANKELELLVGSGPTRDSARTVKLKPVPMGRIQDLRYEEQVREARERVEALSRGRLAYIHIRSMDGASLRRFERELWGMAQAKDGLVLDLRGNGGGSTHDAVLAQLARSAYGFTQPRDGVRSTQPWRHWDRPVALLVDENSVSDAEIFAMGFRYLKLGKIVGERTPGYVIGTYSATLQDGTSYRVPMWRWLAADGSELENVGVAPDVRVVRTGIAAAEDEQLAAAVNLLMKELPAK